MDIKKDIYFDYWEYILKIKEKYNDSNFMKH